MDFLTPNSPSSFDIEDQILNKSKSVSLLIQENTILKSKIALTQELLRNYKLNDMTELMKELKDMKNLICIMKENSQTMSLTIEQQKKEIDKLQKIMRSNETVNEDSYEKIFALSTGKLNFKSKNTKVDSNDKLYDRIFMLENEKSKLKEQIEFYMKKTNELVSEIKKMNDKIENAEKAKQKYEELRVEIEVTNEKGLKKEENAKSSNFRYAQAVKKIDVLIGENKILEEKNQELEADKKKLLEKWQSSLGKVKSEDHAKIKVKELEEQLEAEKKKTDGLLSKLKDINKKHEDLKDQIKKEKSYTEELTTSYRKLHVKSKILFEEKELLSKMNQELNIKAHISQSENPSPEKPHTSNQEETIGNLQKELNKTLLLLKKKGQDITSLELKVTELQITVRKYEQQVQKSSGDSMLIEKYESLLEKYQKLQAEKSQIQSLYIDSSSIISEKALVIQEMSQKIYNLEEKIAFLNSKSQENSKTNFNSVTNTATSRGTNKSSPTRSRISRSFLYSKFESKIPF
ncbi:hypothetical protein SteCoe_20639 [Stentor coeruleus]|uniref:Uncharacterized protein n=1 Tax=Stentor coeruleus TaxID=5963 RepID=A0A1R2BRS3_9CILI|nr:hypothetical protein SteCoe_20639 [Stentor coeruleus]